MPKTQAVLRPIRIRRGFTKTAAGSVLYQCGQTLVLCTASVEDAAPPWMAGQGKGWVTAEYSMLPNSTSPRKRREREKVDGRTTEIQRLIGRSLRAVCDLQALGEKTITVNCDVLEADGGTRTASITGGFLALLDAVESIRKDLPDPEKPIFKDSVAAVSVGIVQGKAELDLDYAKDSSADVNMNVVMTGAGHFIEVQGTGEESTFTQKQLDSLLKLAKEGIAKLTDIQKKAAKQAWPFGG